MGEVWLQLAGQCQRSIRVSASKPFQALPRVSQITQHNIYTGSPRVKTDSTLSAGAGDKATCKAIQPSFREDAGRLESPHTRAYASKMQRVHT
jgi:hypothetical protein